MKYLALAVAVSALGFAGGAASAPPKTNDTGQMKQLADDNDMAWNAGDVEAISRNYATDGTLRLADATEVHQGREAVRRYFAGAFARRPAGLRHITRLDHIDMVTPDVAFADAHVRVEKSNPDGSWSLVREYRNNSIAMREGQEWRLRAVRAYPVPSKPAN